MYRTYSHSAAQSPANSGTPSARASSTCSQAPHVDRRRPIAHSVIGGRVGSAGGSGPVCAATDCQRSGRPRSFSAMSLSSSMRRKAPPSAGAAASPPAAAASPPPPSCSSRSCSGTQSDAPSGLSSKPAAPAVTSASATPLPSIRSPRSVVPSAASTYDSVCSAGAGRCLSDLERFASTQRSARTEPESSLRGSPNAPEGTIVRLSGKA